MCFLIISKTKQNIFLMYADVGPVGHQREVGGPTQRPVRRAVLRDLDLAETLAKL